jgi:hypothetical protein
VRAAATPACDAALNEPSRQPRVHAEERVPPSARPTALGRQVGSARPFSGVDATAPLEICLNDHPRHLQDNRGGGRFTISVNETRAD